MKKFFTFDNEPITGNQYWRRVLAGSWAISFFGIGLWILAATGYKRAGSFGWQREFKILSALFVPIHGIGAFLSMIMRKVGPVETSVLDIFFALGLFFHVVLLFKDGNKNLGEG